ncbi:hypothetical protein PQU92_18215 [Asticcacaulis sp. BYS171W]|uniref:DUF6968 domain-containing protein n=1 Tax=Asticcacaulis aquaticus TaxID=2984212 RepID=A0ABT5HZ69_9CAUL|nr:hypothetical protein [Asticcacaulis aquaticus]MDC7685222.1 hypothetical protein [Asticcacaulis aquaticus]
MNTVVVRERLYAVYPGHTPFEVIVEIGTPYAFEGSDSEWVCPVSIPALNYADQQVHGGSALQALCLALCMVRMHLTLVRDEGGRLSYTADGEDDYDIVSTFGLSDVSPDRH